MPKKTDQDSNSRKLSEKANHARFQIPELAKRLGLMDLDLDIDTTRLDRLKDIFDQLPDQQVIEIADRLQQEKGINDIATTRFIDEFSISPAEGRLLDSLVGGLTVVEHAKQNNVSVNTARTQMRGLLEKTGSSGQLDLVRKFYGRHK